jgi:hypothetical protein
MFLFVWWMWRGPTWIHQLSFSISETSFGLQVGWFAVSVKQWLDHCLLWHSLVRLVGLQCIAGIIMGLVHCLGVYTRWLDGFMEHAPSFVKTGSGVQKLRDSRIACVWRGIRLIKCLIFTFRSSQRIFVVKTCIKRYGLNLFWGQCGFSKFLVSWIWKMLLSSSTPRFTQRW